MDQNRLQHLLTLYFNNRIERADCEELLQYLDESGTHPEELRSTIDECLSELSPNTTFDPQQRELVFEQLKTDIQQLTVKDMRTSGPRRFRWWQAAAILLISLSAGWLIYRGSSSDSKARQPLVNVAAKPDIELPDANRAILTLANGQNIILSDSVSGLFAAEAGVAIRRNADGTISYEPETASIDKGPVAYNTLSTPKGQSYHIRLPDGTDVWLNSGSSLHYPVAFTGTERRVKLTGEAYFEVAKVAGKAFLVDANGSTTRVLGTHFNVSAYSEDEQVTTTLLEGAVQVSKLDESIQLVPGKQALVPATGRITQKDADIRSVMAWKNGYFRFDNETLKTIMTKIARWYDIEEVVYQGDFDDRFTGTFQRSKAISQLFSHLEKLAPVRFEIKERRVIIMR